MRRSRRSIRNDILVPGVGFEPTRPLGQWILSPPRLPFRHPGKLNSVACSTMAQNRIRSNFRKQSLRTLIAVAIVGGIATFRRTQIAKHRIPS